MPPSPSYRSAGFRWYRRCRELQVASGLAWPLRVAYSVGGLVWPEPLRAVWLAWPLRVVYLAPGLVWLAWPLRVAYSVGGLVWLEPLRIDKETLALDVIAEVGPGGHFFGTAQTIEKYETAFYRPLVFNT
ncbi:MAG: trimethylamine methyltransferase family protein, partial [Deltaproteobacteria bacterium]|nr:trimethylamine methyltransferase family protein [Deltaproteobacteria bacterium]